MLEPSHQRLLPCLHRGIHTRGEVRTTTPPRRRPTKRGAAGRDARNARAQRNRAQDTLLSCDRPAGAHCTLACVYLVSHWPPPRPIITTNSKCKEVKCKNFNFNDGYGQFLDRSGVCFDENKSLVVMITDTCPCSYAANYYSNKRWCCGDMYHREFLFCCVRARNQRVSACSMWCIADKHYTLKKTKSTCRSGRTRSWPRPSGASSASSGATSTATTGPATARSCRAGSRRPRCRRGRASRAAGTGAWTAAPSSAAGAASS